MPVSYKCRTCNSILYPKLGDGELRCLCGKLSVRRKSYGDWVNDPEKISEVIGGTET